VHVLLTGASGFIGRRLGRRLLARGDQVTGISKDKVISGDTRSLGVDLVDAAALEAATGHVSPELIIHLAGRASVGASWEAPGDYFRVNVLATENLLRRFPDVRVLLASSAEVYGVVPEEEQPLTEDRLPSPVNPYALTKAAAERLVLAAGGTVMRLFTLVGRGQSRRFALPSFAEQLAELERSGGGTMKVGNLSARRDFVHVEDAIDAMLLLSAGKGSENVYNIGSGEVTSMRDALDRLLGLAAVEVRVEEDERRMRPADAPLFSADGRRLRSLGWSPTRSLDDALVELLEESREAASASL